MQVRSEMGRLLQGTLADEGYMISWPTFIKTWDGGDYTRWQYDAGTQFGRNLGLNIDPSTWNDKGIWPVSWYSIYTRIKVWQILTNLSMRPMLKKE